MIIYQGGSLLRHKLISQLYLKDSFPKFSILIPFIEIKKGLRILDFMGNVYIDSGAFSAWTKKITIKIEDYIKFLYENKEKITTYANLDVIGNAGASYKNYKIMVKEGLKPQPVYHEGEDIKYLFKYADNTNYIGLGGIAKTARLPRRHFFNRVFQNFPNPDKIKFHGFGVTAWDLLKSYPWYSVDSTSAMMNAITGGIMTPWGSYTISVRAQQKDFTTKEIELIHDYILQKNYKIEELNTGDMIGVIMRLKFNIEYMADFIKNNCTKIYKSKTNYLF
jgi:hypothetical protein